MNLIKHQIRQEIRQHQVVLILLGAFLLLDLANNLGWFDSPFDAGRAQEPSLLAMANSLLGFSLSCLLGAICVLSFLRDSPARTDGFLNTRPMPRSALYQAKAIFLILFVVLPPVFFEAVHLLLQNVGLANLLHGCVERLLFVLPAAVCAAAFTALWPSGKKFGVGLIAFQLMVLATSLAAYPGLMLLKSLFNPKVGLPSANNPGIIHLLIALYVLAAGLTWLAWQSAAHRWSARKLWLRLASLAVIGNLAVAACPWSRLEPRAADPEKAAAFASQIQLLDLPGSINLTRNSDAADPNLLGLTIAPTVESQPDSLVVRWFAGDTEIKLHDGQSIRPAFVTHRPSIGFRDSFSRPDDQRAAMLGLPEDTLIQGDFSPGISLFAGRFHLPVDAPQMKQPASISAQFAGHVYEVETVADLPIELGASANDEFGKWTLVGIPDLSSQLEYGASEALHIQRKQLRFALTSNLATTRPRHRLDGVYRFVLVNEERAVLTEHRRYPRLSRVAGSHTAFSRQTATLDFEHDVFGSPFRSPGLDGVRLRILRYRYLGEVKKQWSRKDIVLADVYSDHGHGSSNRLQNDELTKAELQRRLDELPAPPPGASRVEAGKYINEILLLVEAARANSSDAEQAVAKLAALVPEHFEAFLDARPEAPHYARMALTAALESGLRDDQKHIIFAALRSRPDLTCIVLARDWTDDARSEILDLLDHANPLPYAAFQGIAWFEDPATYPKLLAHFEASPNPGIYDILRQLPGIEARLNESVARVWKDRRRSFNHSFDFDAGRRIALRHGMPAALEEAYRLAPLTQSASGGNSILMMSELGKLLALPNIKRKDRYDSNKLLAAMAAYRPGELIFDSVRRHYKPRSNAHPLSR